VLSVSPKIVFPFLVRCTYAPGALAKYWVIQTPKKRKEKSMVLLLLLFHYCSILNLENPKPQSPLCHNPHWGPLHSPGFKINQVVTKAPGHGLTMPKTGLGI